MSRARLLSFSIIGGVWRLFALASAVLIILLGILYGHLRQASEMAAEVQRTEDIDRELRDLESELLGADSGMRGFLLSGVDYYLEPYLVSVRRAPEHMLRIQKLVRDPQLKEQLASLAALIAAKQASMRATIELMQAGRAEEALALFATGEGWRQMSAVQATLAAAMAREQQLLVERRARFAAGIDRLLAIALVGGGIAVLALLMLAAITATRLRRPLQNLMDGIGAMAAGDLEHRVAVSTADEIGRLTACFNNMADRALAAKRAQDAVEKELERSNAELDNFAYVASHDLKAPLRGIRNLAQWIRDDLGDTVSEETGDNLRMLENRVDRLDSLLEGLLDYSRVGRKDGSATWLDSGELVDEIAEYLAPPAAFSVVREGPMPTLMAPKAALERVFRNLISNALKHHDRSSGRVVISGCQRDGCYEFSVADDGPGISPEYHQRIFQMFQTLRPRDQVEGSGMGLTIAKKTVEQFGGTIAVVSQPPVRGTTFIFTWGQAQPNG